MKFILIQYKDYQNLPSIDGSDKLRVWTCRLVSAGQPMRWQWLPGGTDSDDNWVAIPEDMMPINSSIQQHRAICTMAGDAPISQFFESV